jgi:hypothetical protein
MHVLFVHQNFPAQFRFIAPRLAQGGWDCTFVTARDDALLLPGVTPAQRSRHRPDGEQREV